MSARLRLRRADGLVYLDRWGFEWKRLGGIFLHKMEAPDPGVDLHDHPWWFLSVIIKGGYWEKRCDTRMASAQAREAVRHNEGWPRGATVDRKRFSFKTMRLDECHRIIELKQTTSWSIIIHGPSRRLWGFYIPEGWIHWQAYERSGARDLHAEISSNDPPGSRR